MKINISNAYKTYSSGDESITALNNISFQIESNSFCTIIGSSGSGKSTLLYSIAGLERLDSGVITLGHIDLLSLSEKEVSIFRNQHIGFIFQQFMLLNDFTIEENVMLPYFIKTKNKTESLQNAHILLEKLGLKEKFKNYPTQLSGGQAQRVAIARALINNPSIILADEPTGNLDRKNQSIVLDLLLELKQEFNFTLLFVTHNTEITKIATQTIHLEFGEIV